MPIKGKQILDGSIDKEKLSFELYYLHIQDIASDTWTINHNLDKYTNVLIYDTNDISIEGEIQTLNSNTIRILFNTSISGKVIIH